MASAELLAPMLERCHQIGVIEPESTPVFDHAQAFPRPIEIGIDQPVDACLGLVGDNHRFHGSLGTIARTFAAMENGGSDSPMKVLVWGILLLGGIGVFIVWGLTNAYPGSVL